MALSIEIRSSHVYFVEANVSKNRIVVKKSHAFEFPDYWINSQGVQEMDDFSLLMEQHLDEQKISEKKVSICLNNSSIIYRELQVPKLDEKRLPLVVRSEMMNALNLTPDYIMDFVILNEFDTEDGPMYRVLAVAILTSALESYLKLFKKINLKPVVIDSATNSVIKLINRGNVVSDEQVMIADVGNGHLRLYLFEDGQYALSRNSRLVALTEDNREEVLAVVEEHINKMIQFSFTRGNNRGVKKVILTGIDELLNDIAQSVIENLNMQCVVLEKPEFIHCKTTFETKFVNALGALLRD